MKASTVFVRIAAAVVIFAGVRLAGAELAPQWELVIPADKKGNPKQTFPFTADQSRLSADVTKITGIAPGAGKRAWINGTIKSEKEETILLGTGADFFYKLYVNGELVSSTATTGNPVSGKAVGPDNLMQFAHLQKGENKLRIFLESGSGGFRFEMAPLPVTRANLAKTFAPDFEKNFSEVLFTVPGSEAIGLVFSTQLKVYSDLEYRETGKEEWRKISSEAPAAGVIPMKTLHHFRLTGLRPGAEYEYRTNLYNRGRFRKGPAGKFTFRPDDGKPFSFFVTGDTQLAPDEVRRYMNGYRQSLQTDACAFLVHTGDMTTFTESFEKQYFEPFIRPLNAKRPDRPVVLVRGNHELLGPGAAEWVARFGAEGKKGYYAFRYGKCCFIVLDTGENKDYGRLGLLFTGFPEYLAQERAWLEAYTKTEEFQQAEFRIVLAHAYPAIPGKNLSAAVKLLAEGLFFGPSPKHKIHLWIAGHTHRYERTLPGEAHAFFAPRKRKAETAAQNENAALPQIPFTVLVCDGPSVVPKSTGARIDCGETLRVTVRIPNGSLLDEFEIGKDGKLIKSTPSPKLQKLSFDEIGGVL